MHHTMQISVTKKPRPGGVAMFRSISVREKILRRLLGDKAKLTVIVPGDTVDEVAIKEVADDDKATRSP